MSLSEEHKKMMLATLDAMHKYPAVQLTLATTDLMLFAGVIQQTCLGLPTPPHFLDQARNIVRKISMQLPEELGNAMLLGFSSECQAEVGDVAEFAAEMREEDEDDEQGAD